MSSDIRNYVIPKPWGWEYLVFETSEVALWLLHIAQGKSTSLHCHPTKTTGLLLLTGTAELSFINDRKAIVAPNKQMIRRGLFHATTATSNGGCYLLEIENPNDKNDLVRLSDHYGRDASGYEDRETWLARSSDHIWISDMACKSGASYTVDDSQFFVRGVTEPRDFDSFEDNDVIMFLKGGLGKVINGRSQLATVGGDIGVGQIVKQVASNMEFCEPETVVLVVPSGRDL